MAIVNDRDVLLQNTTPRVISQSLAITGNSAVFTKVQQSPNLVPSNITLTATAGTIYSGAATYAWSYAINTAPNTWVITGTNSNTLSIPNSTFSGYIGSATYVNYRCIITEPYKPTMVSYYTINYFQQVDAKYYQSSEPSSGMVDGDIWIDSDTGRTYRYNGAVWVDISGRGKQYRVISRGGSDTAYASQQTVGLYNAEVNTLLQSPVRSYNLIRISRTSGDVTFSQTYDVYGVGANTAGRTAATLAADLNASDNTSIIVLYTATEPQAHRTDSSLPTAVYRCGGSSAIFGSTNFKIGSAYILVGIPGMGEGSGFEAYNGDTNNNVNAWCDVYFEVNNSNLLITGSASVPRTLVDYGYSGSLDATANIIYTTTPPGSNNHVGDLWFDTNDNNRLYKWNGSTWLDVEGKAVRNAGDNLVTNSSFEIDTNGDGLSDNWIAYSSGQVGVVTYSRPTAVADRVFGSYAQRIYASSLGTNASDRVGIYQTINVRNMAGSTFRVSGYGRMEYGNGPFNLYIDYSGDSGFISSGTGIGNIGIFPGWTRFWTNIETIPTNATTATIFLVIHQNSTGPSPAQFILDGINFTIGDLVADYAAGFYDNLNTNITIDALGNLTNIGSILPNVANNIDSRIDAPGGASYVSASTGQLGAIKITLPTGPSDTMMNFIVDIYEYTGGYACSMVISGYAYNNSGTPTWVNTTARVLGGSNVEYPIRFGYAGSSPTWKMIIWIGNNAVTTPVDNTPWSYPQVRVRDFFAGYANYTKETWSTGWTITFDNTAPTGVTSTILDTLPGADWSKLSKTGTPLATALPNVAALTQSTQIDNSLITLTGLGLTPPVLINDGNCSVLGNTLTKTGAGGVWNASVRSKELFNNGIFITFIATTGQDVMVGINDNQTTVDFTDINIAIFTNSTSQIQVYEEGSIVSNTLFVGGVYPSYATGDVISLVYDRVTVACSKNGVIFYTKNYNNTNPLFVDTSLYQQGSVIKGLDYGPITSQILANSKINTFITGPTPSATTIGDLWFNSAEGYKLYRATAIGTGNWIAYQYDTGAILPGAVTSQISSSYNSGSVSPSVGSTGVTLVSSTFTFTPSVAGTIVTTVSGYIELFVPVASAITGCFYTISLRDGLTILQQQQITAPKVDTFTYHTMFVPFSMTIDHARASTVRNYNIQVECQVFGGTFPSSSSIVVFCNTVTQLLKV